MTSAPTEDGSRGDAAPSSSAVEPRRSRPRPSRPRRPPRPPRSRSRERRPGRTPPRSPPRCRSSTSPRPSSRAEAATARRPGRAESEPTTLHPDGRRRGAAKREAEAEGGQPQPRNRNRNAADAARAAASRTSQNDQSGQNGQQNQNQNAERPGGGQTSASSGHRGRPAGPAAVSSVDADGSGRNRYRDRKRGRGPVGDDFEPEITDDDVLIPVAGILDVLDNYAFVRTTGYLPGTNDVYVSLGQVKKYNLRKGDAVVGAIRQPRDGDSRPGSPEVQRDREDRLRQRPDRRRGRQPRRLRQAHPDLPERAPAPRDRAREALDPHHRPDRPRSARASAASSSRRPKAGKTLILQAIAKAIAVNNPEVHIMVVLVDERPEEVTDMQRTVKGEVIASTFDRPAEDHTTVAELAIERAKRLVELGNDVVVLLDSITRLGRAYNLASPASGRILSGGVDASALYPPKRFFGAARNIEERRLADHPRDRARRDRIQDGRGHLRGVQGHRQHGAAPRRVTSPTSGSSRPSTSTPPAPAARRSCSAPTRSRSPGACAGLSPDSNCSRQLEVVLSASSRRPAPTWSSWCRSRSRSPRAAATAHGNAHKG